MSWWPYLLVGLGGIIATIVIVGMITIAKLKERVREESRNEGKQLYAIIEDVQPNKVKLSHYDYNGNKHSTKTYESSSGVDSSIHRGMRINQY